VLAIATAVVAPAVATVCGARSQLVCAWSDRPHAHGVYGVFAPSRRGDHCHGLGGGLADDGDPGGIVAVVAVSLAVRMATDSGAPEGELVAADDEDEFF